MELQENLEAFESLNATVWGISPDADAGRMTSFRDESGITFPLLIDADLTATKAYGILNEKQDGVPHPTVAIVDREGVVRFFHLDENYRQRPPVETLLDAVREIDTAPEGT